MGVLVGLEIPLLMRIVKDRYQFRDVIAHVSPSTISGALERHCCSGPAGARLGLVRSAMLFGLNNAAVPRSGARTCSPIKLSRTRGCVLLVC